MDKMDKIDKITKCPTLDNNQYKKEKKYNLRIFLVCFFSAKYFECKLQFQNWNNVSKWGSFRKLEQLWCCSTLPSLSGKGFFSWVSTSFKLPLSNLDTPSRAPWRAISVFITEITKTKLSSILQLKFIKFRICGFLAQKVKLGVRIYQRIQNTKLMEFFVKQFRKMVSLGYQF